MGNFSIQPLLYEYSMILISFQLFVFEVIHAHGTFF